MKAILSIQSHVCHGYVGNRAAVFPLQRLGYELDVINTVQFSNHTGYGSWQGMVFGADHIRSLIQGLDERGALEKCGAVLSGYLGDPAIGQEILQAVQRCRMYDTSLVYLCDPVMGDVGRGFFVRPGIPDFFKKQALPYASIMTPNHFEFEALAGKKIQSLEDTCEACAQLHMQGPDIIVITSFECIAVPPQEISVFLSVKNGAFWMIRTPRLQFPIAPNGTGDMFSALFLGNYLKHENPVVALEETASSLFSVLTYMLQEKMRELPMVQTQDFLLNPPYRFSAERVFI